MKVLIDERRYILSVFKNQSLVLFNASDRRALLFERTLQAIIALIMNSSRNKLTEKN